MLLELIENEIERRRQGQEARITAKINSLVDPQIIDALYEASRAGVPVDLNVRGICCLLPGVPGMSDNISVISILDRFLEHARIFCFHNGGKPQVFLSSADWMPRNFDRRVELLVQVEDRTVAQRLIHILQTSLADNVQGRRLQADGVYVRLTPKNRKAVRSQEIFYRETCEAAEQAARQPEKVFVPQTSQGK